MSERRRSAAALSSRAHAFSVEALIGSNKKRKLRGWEEKELELSMESLATEGEDPAHCLDMDPGQWQTRTTPSRSRGERGGGGSPGLARWFRTRKPGWEAGREHGTETRSWSRERDLGGDRETVRARCR